MGEWKYSPTMINFGTLYGSEFSASLFCRFTPREVASDIY
jgi:hypothetical protein